jgi:quercetin dioxygenase-like cupin family protein
MPIPRRTFLQSAISGCPALAASLSLPLGWGAQIAANNPDTPLPHPTGSNIVGAGQDRLGKVRTLGFSSLAFKVTADMTAGNLFVIEHTNLQPGGGPALHLHNSQEEWFYVLEGRVIFEIGAQRAQLSAGESVLALPHIPHTFSALGAPAHLLIAFTPAGKMEQYFLDAEANPALAATADFMNRYEMQWIGPSPFWKS